MDEQKLYQYLDTKFTAIEIQFNETNRKVDNIEIQLSETNRKVDNIKIQLSETNQIVRAIHHHQEYSTATLEGLKTTTATSESVRRIESKLSVLNNDLFDQRAEIAALKIAL